ncbi:MAG: hypothetical protein HY537_02105, partial [Deltaproteobacteria bacterium]|nr:hypothetical protein [Deltaproteobacteria bacterium]
PRNIFALGISNYANYFRGEANFDEVGICFHDETIFIRVQQNFRRHVEVYLSGVRVAWKRSALSPIEIKRHPLFRTQIIVRKRNRLQQFILVRNVYVELALYWLGYLHVTSNTTFPESLKKLLVSRNAAKRELSCLSMFLVFNNRNSVTYDDRLLRRTISVNLALSLLGQRFKNTLSISDEKACDKSLPGTDGHERTLTLGYDAYYPNRAVARFIAEQLRPIGLKVRLVETNFVKPNWSNDMQLVILNEPSNRQCLNYFSLGYLSPLKKSPEQFKLFYELISQCIASDTDIDLKAGPLASLMHDQVPFIPIARLKNFYLLRPGFEDPYNGL